MRHGTAHDGGVQHAARVEVVDVTPRAAQQPQILDTLDRRSDECSLGRHFGSFAPYAERASQTASMMLI